MVCNKILILSLLSTSRGVLNNSDILGSIPFATFAMGHLGKVGFVVQPQLLHPCPAAWHALGSQLPWLGSTCQWVNYSFPEAPDDIPAVGMFVPCMNTGKGDSGSSSLINSSP